MAKLELSEEDMLSAIDLAYESLPLDERLEIDRLTAMVWHKLALMRSVGKISERSIRLLIACTAIFENNHGKSWTELM